MNLPIKKIKTKTIASLIFFSFVANPVLADTESNYHRDFSHKNIPGNPIPGGLTINSVNYYDGDSDDLVTGGIGFTALTQSYNAPTFADPTNPTTQELRQAKLNRFIDAKTAEGSLFGFQREKLTPLFDGKIAGSEILATYHVNERVGMLLQIPLDFDKNNPCIVAVPATDSDGLYNAKDVQIRGLWGLRHNCAVVYNDKGLGNGVYDITTGQGFTVDGKTDKDNILFQPQISNHESYIKNYPNRYAIKQLHSKMNPEQRWGEYVIKSIEFAFYELNNLYPSKKWISFHKDNTIVLVYAAGDGAGAALKAGELDRNNIINGIVAVNPQIQPSIDNNQLIIQKGNKTKSLMPKSLIDYSTQAALYIPCAISAIKPSKFDDNVPYASKYLYSLNRCEALKKAGLLKQGTPEEALKQLEPYGFTADLNYQLPYFYYTESIGFPYQYISAYGRYDVTENMCDYSVASTQQSPIMYQGKVEALQAIPFEQIWGLSNGHLPVWNGDDATILDLVENKDLLSPRREFYSQTETQGKIDYGTKGAICLREKINDPRVINGHKQVLATGDLRNKKTIIVHGANNVKQLPNDTSRAYVALNSKIEGPASQLRYIEIENASYLDGTAPFDNTLLAIDYYGEDAMEWLWSNVTSDNKTALPESQLVRAKARGGNSGHAPQATSKNLVPILQTPDTKDLIKIENGKITLPN